MAGMDLLGIHHVTALAGDPQRNIAYYTRMLGFRLVKRTVNFDDPTTYHLYYGDEVGRPGTILTFFPWPGGRHGRQGTGQIGAVALSVPRGSLGYWLERLIRHGVRYDGPVARFGDRVVTFRDPDGLVLELVASDKVVAWTGWGGGHVPAEHAIRRVHGVTLWEDDSGPTARLLTDILGFRLVGEEGARRRYEVGAGHIGGTVDIMRAAGFWQGVVEVGTVHHVAWRTRDEEQQLRWRDDLIELGLSVTPVRDRQYFRSIYFREPGGVLFEIATDTPGFTVDEPRDRLGSVLKLPPWLERSRPSLERVLPEIRLPEAEGDRDKA